MSENESLASFDANTQAKAQEELDRFLSIYKISGNMIRAEEVAAAVQKGLDASGDDTSAASFGEHVREHLQLCLYLRMVDYAKKGEDVPSELDPEQYAKLRRALEQKHGALPGA